MTKEITTLVFDWGNTIMKDLGLPGAMKDWESVAWMPGAEEALAALEGQYRLVIATSANHSDTADMREALKRVGADRYFQHFFSAKELGFAKPDPRFFLEILSQLSVDPENAASIGDRYDNDIEAARNAGLATIWISASADHSSYPAADHIIPAMDQLPAILAPA
jgi:putative hydrolase of the HAD superfamily